MKKLRILGLSMGILTAMTLMAEKPLRTTTSLLEVAKNSVDLRNALYAILYRLNGNNPSALTRPIENRLNQEAGIYNQQNKQVSSVMEQIAMLRKKMEMIERHITGQTGFKSTLTTKKKKKK